MSISSISDGTNVELNLDQRPRWCNTGTEVAGYPGLAFVYRVLRICHWKITSMKLSDYLLRFAIKAPGVSDYILTSARYAK